MLDNRLDSKLFAFEVAYLIAFTENVTEIIYEELVKKIIELRSLSNEDLAVLFEKDRHAYVNSAYEWDYYVSNLLVGAGIFQKKRRRGVVLDRADRCFYRAVHQ